MKLHDWTLSSSESSIFWVSSLFSRWGNSSDGGGGLWSGLECSRDGFDPGSPQLPSVGKESACNAGDPGSILGREDPLEKEMATHSSILAWRIPQTEEPGKLQSVGLQRVGHDWAINFNFPPSSKILKQDFPSGPVVKTLHFQCRGQASTPGQGTRSHILQLRVHMPKLKIPTSMNMCYVASVMSIPCDPMDCSPRGSTLYGFSRQEYWNELLCSPPWDLPNSGVEPASLKSPALAGRFLTMSTTIPQQRYHMPQLRPSTNK